MRRKQPPAVEPYPHLTRGTVVLYGSRGLYVVVARQAGPRSALALLLEGVEWTDAVQNLSATVAACPSDVRAVRVVEPRTQAVVDLVLAAKPEPT